MIYGSSLRAVCRRDVTTARSDFMAEFFSRRISDDPGHDLSKCFETVMR